MSKPEIHLGILDDMEHEAKISGDAEYRQSELRIQALGAAISRRDWHAAEQAYAAIRDKFHSRAAQPLMGVERAAGQEWRDINLAREAFQRIIDFPYVGVEASHAIISIARGGLSSLFAPPVAEPIVVEKSQVK